MLIDRDARGPHLTALGACPVGRDEASAQLAADLDPCEADRRVAQTTPRRVLDAESQSWWERLHASEPIRGWAIAELHERLRREAGFHVRRRVVNLAAFPRSDIDDLATEAAGDALIVLLRKLED